jgi:hypothetical protein
MDHGANSRKARRQRVGDVSMTAREMRARPFA